MKWSYIKAEFIYDKSFIIYYNNYKLLVFTPYCHIFVLDTHKMIKNMDLGSNKKRY